MFKDNEPEGKMASEGEKEIKNEGEIKRERERERGGGGECSRVDLETHLSIAGIVRE